MKASDHTLRMLQWWRLAGIDRAELAIRRTGGTMIVQRRVLDDLPLRWARAENVRGADVYIRPAREEAWPLVLLDDVDINRARRIAAKYAALVVRTSAPGGCHIWLRCRRPLDEQARLQAQSWLIPRVGADPGSVSGEHFGRLAGCKNWKRGGTWINVIEASGGLAWDPTPVIGARTERSAVVPPSSAPDTACDTSASGREWGWVCGQLSSGQDPLDVYVRLLDQAQSRRGADAHRYALRTVQQARIYVQRAS